MTAMKKIKKKKHFPLKSVISFLLLLDDVYDVPKASFTAEWNCISLGAAAAQMMMPNKLIKMKRFDETFNWKKRSAN